MFNNINFDYMENSNEIKKIDSSMVECPFCKNVIEAPSKPDVIFKCPQCFERFGYYFDHHGFDGYGIHVFLWSEDLSINALNKI